MEFKDFFQNLTGYRISEIYILLGKSGLIDIVKSYKNGASIDKICKSCNWDIGTGGRFIEALTHIEILEKKENKFYPTQFAEMFFLKNSGNSQNESLNFEDKLTKSWNTLENVLKTGKRDFNTDDKDQASYENSLKQYISAMDDAACIRSTELWDAIQIDTKGKILDVGAGSGAFLCEFLERNINWKGIFCDLNDVIDIAKKNQRIMDLRDRISFHPCNLLDNPFANLEIRPDIILISNVIHCYNIDEIRVIFRHIQQISTDKTYVIIHDFFKDTSWHGALYDIHMMLNTYSGKTYVTNEIIDILKECGFIHANVQTLSSYSAVITGSKE
ncbi:MAG: class I SAM-dependent methyltransferase [Desulfobacterales bacterium]|nr:class I SAM-dependent methyltransferase [Desulfobacterales bacterium]